MKIGLEVHVALPTKSKLFCSCSTDPAEPNTAICPICMGFPGSKPMLNKAAVESALGIANSLHCVISKDISFVRKVYFYPDLPKSYQITQMEGSIGIGGYLAIGEKKVRIRRVQIEEDPAQIIREGALTLIDFNRSGTPLVEIVTEPDISSEEEMRSFIGSLRSILYYLGVDINKEIKADVNISLAETRVEVKNVTGIKNMIETLRFEIERQTEAIRNGEEIARETRGYNEKARSTQTLREKETDEEYGYIFESDLTLFRTEDLKCNRPVYANEVAMELANGTDVSPKTVSEIIMLDSYSLGQINRLRGRHELRSIIHGIERYKKYGSMERVPDSVLDNIVLLIEGGKEVSKESIQDLEAGKEVKVEYSELPEGQLEKLIDRYLAENPDLVREYARQPKTINLIIENIARPNGLHPKEVARKLMPILNRIAEVK